jgi:periplasmic protein TonB
LIDSDFARNPQVRSERNKISEPNPRIELVKTESGRANKQRSRLLIALSLLLVALTAVLVRDRDFWFGPDEALDSGSATPASVPSAELAPAPAKTPAPAPQPLTAQNQLAPRTSTEAAVAEPKNTPKAASLKPASAATKRHVLPPLQVEVVAHERRTAHPESNVAKVELPNDSKRVEAASMAALPTNAAEREPLSSAVPELRQTMNATYPLLAPRMSVEGSVVMQAVIGADGAIENLRILSGPAILTAAAQQAVRQWHFKPYLQNGEPVETKATITVNFSIRISDSAAKTS